MQYNFFLALLSCKGAVAFCSLFLGLHPAVGEENLSDLEKDHISQQENLTWYETLKQQPTLITKPWLTDHGIDLSGKITQFAFGVSGGVDNPAAPPPFGQGDTSKYTGNGQYDARFDLDKIVGLPHGRLLVRAEHWWGSYGNVSLNSGSFSPPVFGAALPPAPDSEGQLFLTNFVYTQPLHKNFAFFVGKKDVLGDLDQDKFAGGDGTDQFMNQALVANPAFLLGMPYSSLATGFVVPGEDGHLIMWARDPEDRTQDYSPGSPFSSGVIAGGEVRLRTNFAKLPGHQTFGGIWKGYDQSDLRFALVPPSGQYANGESPTSQTKSDAWTAYYSFDQYLQAYETSTVGEERGWGIFGRASISDGNPTPVTLFYSLGIGGDSPIPNRENDTFGLGWFHTVASDEFSEFAQSAFGISDGSGWELYYNVEVLPWLRVTPDVQFLKPGLENLASSSVVVGGIRVQLKL